MRLGSAFSPTALLVFLFLRAPAWAQNYPEYHDITDVTKAQAEAETRHLPLAWVGGDFYDLNLAMPEAGGEADVLQMTMKMLQDRAVIVFFDGTNPDQLPSIARNQYPGPSGGPMGLVLTDPAVTHALGQFSFNELKTYRGTPLNSRLSDIAASPLFLKPDSGASPDQAAGLASPLPAVPTVPPLATGSTAPPESTSSPVMAPGDGAPAATAIPAGDVPAIESAAPTGRSRAADDVDLSDDERQISNFLNTFGVYVALGIVAAIIGAQALSKKKS